MKKIVLLFITSAIFLMMSCDENSNEPVNSAPVIQSITSTPSSIKVNEQSSITCIAIDAEGDNLTYNWSATHGTFTDGTQDSTVLWVAPGNSGIYEIGVIVSDGEKTSEDVVNITVDINSPPLESSNPIPSDGSVEQLMGLYFSWTCSDPNGDSLSYDFYFGTSPDPELVISNLTETSFNKDNLFANTTYFWKVVAKDGIMETEGDVWSFTTAAAANNFEFVTVPAGEYTYGKDNEIKTMDYDYHLMKYEVTNTQYINFLNEAFSAGAITITSSAVTGYFKGDTKWTAGEYVLLDLEAQAGSGYNVRKIGWNGSSFTISEGYENHPVVLVTWFGANAFANYYGLRLPTEYEWEKAARGNTGYTYPWGETFDGWDANFWHSDDPWEKGTTPVGWFNGVNPETRDRPTIYGAYDMMGNVWEWTNSYWTDVSLYPVLRGGAWNINATNFYLRTYTRDTFLPDNRNYYTGFRCAKD